MSRLRIAPPLALVLIALVQLSTFAADVPFQKAPTKLHNLRDGLPNFFAKLKGDKTVQIAYLGGSITAQNGWRPKTLKWFQGKFPKAKVEQIDAAIGGTGSDLGVFRVYQDALQHKPDLLFVEFAVNDGGASPEQIYKAMEGIVRQTWKLDPTIDICFVYTIAREMLVDYQAGTFPCSASAMEHLADHYGIPSIAMAMRVAELEKEGKLIFTGDPTNPDLAGKIVFSQDTCHPTDAGHEVFLEVIAQAMEKMEPLGTPGPHSLKEPFRADNWEEAKMIPITQEMLIGSWRKMEPEEGLAKRFGNRLPQMWLGSTPGDKITFKFRGTTARLYDLLGPDGGQIRVTVDGKPVEAPVLRFDSYCTYHRLGTASLCENLPDGEHTVSIEILAEQPDREAVLQRVRNTPGFDPVTYNGTNVWAGYLLILGDLVK